LLVEMLLDHTLVEEQADAAQRYYQALERVEVPRLQQVVELLALDARGLDTLIQRFLDVRFLADYAEDHRVVRRLNAVLARVRLPEAPPALAEQLPQFRVWVRQAVPQLLLSAMAESE
jgi:hypothetical protein